MSEPNSVEILIIIIIFILITILILVPSFILTLLFNLDARCRGVPVQTLVTLLDLNIDLFLTFAHREIVIIPFILIFLVSTFSYRSILIR